MQAAIVGTGHIAESYAHTLMSYGISIPACYDINRGRADAFSRRWSSTAVHDLADIHRHRPDVAVNLTPPMQHAAVSKILLELDIPVYSEKPLAHELDAGRTLVETSDARNVPLLCAPDILLGAVHRRLRRSVDAGLIGRPLFVCGHIAWPGHERWHPRPEFFYKAGGGPLLDLGPYWITAMINVVGPVTAVTAVGSPLTVKRTLTSLDGGRDHLVPEIPTSIALLIEFRSGVIGSLGLSFDWPCTASPPFEIIGEEGSLVCDTPLFEGVGELRYRSTHARDWVPLPGPASLTRWRRGAGVIEMLTDPIRAAPYLDKKLALHVLEIMQAAQMGMAKGVRTIVTSDWENPSPP
jgi:predicted dehydrogenase